jgi:hypothetical protein
MSTYTSFVDMSRAEAREFLAGFLEQMGPRLEWLAAESAGSVDLDLTVDSLDPLWAWSAPKFRWREGYEPPPLGMPGPQITLEQLEPAEELPSWFEHPSGAGYAEFSCDTLWLIDGLGRYLGETLLRHVPGTSWQAAHSRRAGYIFQNQPVIAGLADDFNPVHSCAILAARALRGGSPRGSQTLRDLYSVHVQPVTD